MLGRGAKRENKNSADAPFGYTTENLPLIFPSPFCVWIIFLAASASESFFLTAACGKVGFKFTAS